MVLIISQFVLLQSSKEDTVETFYAPPFDVERSWTPEKLDELGQRINSLGQLYPDNPTDYRVSVSYYAM